MQKFKDLELKFLELRNKAELGEIDSATVNKELKKLMVMDSKGAYWIIGGNSGKWYKYNGKDWKEDNPYKLEEKQEKEIEKKINNTTQIIKTEIKTETKDVVQESKKSDPIEIEPIEDNNVICKNCKGKINNFENYCHICGANQKESVPQKIKKDQQNIYPELYISSINIVSLIFFMGGLGIIFGVILGATAGIFKDIPLYIDFPNWLIDMRSNITGGIIFAIIGGIIGLIIFALKAVFLGSLYNMISYFFGGIRFKTNK